MQRREKILAIAVAVIVVGAAGYHLAQRAVVERFKDLNSQKQAIGAVVARLDDEKFAIESAEQRIQNWTARSFPPDAVAAQRMYLAWLTDLAQSVGFTSPKLAPERGGGTRNKIFTPFRVKLEATATFPQLCGFLYQFRRTDLLHRIADLTVKGDGGSATKPLDITLVAEGLSLKNAAPRDALFPRTELAAALQPSDNRLTVAKVDGFPKEGEFRIRAGGELLNVQSIAENAWTVARGVDGTTAAAHKQGDTVELVPVLAQWKDRKIEDFRALTSTNPFAKPEKPKPPASPPSTVQKPNVASEDPAAKTTKFVGSTVVNQDRQVCFLDPASDKRTIVKEGASFSVAGIKGTLVAINPTHVLIQIEQDKWRLDLGKELASMKKLDKSGNPIPTPVAPQIAADKAAPASGKPDASGDKSKPLTGTPDPKSGKEKTDSPPQKDEKKAAEGGPAPGEAKPAPDPKPATSESAPASASDAAAETQPAPAATASDSSDAK